MGAGESRASVGSPWQKVESLLTSAIWGKQVCDQKVVQIFILMKLLMFERVYRLMYMWECMIICDSQAVLFDKYFESLNPAT